MNETYDEIFYDELVKQVRSYFRNDLENISTETLYALGKQAGLTHDMVDDILEQEIRRYPAIYKASI